MSLPTIFLCAYSKVGKRQTFPALGISFPTRPWQSDVIKLVSAFPIPSRLSLYEDTNWGVFKALHTLRHVHFPTAGRWRGAASTHVVRNKSHKDY